MLWLGGTVSSSCCWNDVPASSAVRVVHRGIGRLFTFASTALHGSSVCTGGSDARFAGTRLLLLLPPWNTCLNDGPSSLCSLTLGLRFELHKKNSNHEQGPVSPRPRLLLLRGCDMNLLFSHVLGVWLVHGRFAKTTTSVPFPQYISTSQRLEVSCVPDFETFLRGSAWCFPSLGLLHSFPSVCSHFIMAEGSSSNLWFRIGELGQFCTS